MGVYNKDMDMPHGCFDCAFSASCFWTAGNRRAGTGNCPLVEIDVPHGKLIDALRIEMQISGAIEAAINENKDFANAFRDADGELSTQWWVVEDMIENAPAIIESEGMPC